MHPALLLFIRQYLWVVCAALVLLCGGLIVGGALLTILLLKQLFS